MTRKTGNLFLISLHGVILLVVLLCVADAFTCNDPTEEEEAECEIKRKQMAAEHPEREIVQAYCGCEPEYAGEEGERCSTISRRCRSGLVCADLEWGEEITLYNDHYNYGSSGSCSTTPIPTPPPPGPGEEPRTRGTPRYDWWN